MTPEASKLVMIRFTDFINTASETLATELISPDAIFHVPGRSEPMRGPAGYLAIIQMMRGGFPDIQWTLEEMVAEGDKVAARFTMRGTHLGTFFGSPSTGKKIGPGAEYLSSVWRADHRRNGGTRSARIASANRCGPCKLALKATIRLLAAPRTRSVIDRVSDLANAIAPQTGKRLRQPFFQHREQGQT